MRKAGFAIVLALVWSAAPDRLAYGAQAAQQDQSVDSGRVVVTVTTLEGEVHMPGVQVELRSADGKVAIARSQTDGAGQVAFPDVPAGDYIVTATHPGFVSRDSTTFTVRSGEVAQVLLDVRLTFVPPDVQVEAETPLPTDSVQPV
jgi:hypothetical protein